MNDTISSLRGALEGLDIAIVGGDLRDAQVDRLRRTFALHDVVHRPTRQSDPSPRAFEAALNGPRVALAIWLCGLSRTNHGKNVRAICKRLGIPWLDCPHVPHPNLLAALICEHRLMDAIFRRRATLTAVDTSGDDR
jgi:hypothetical protein